MTATKLVDKRSLGQRDDRQITRENKSLSINEGTRRANTNRRLQSSWGKKKAINTE